MRARLRILSPSLSMSRGSPLRGRLAGGSSFCSVAPLLSRGFGFWVRLVLSGRRTGCPFGFGSPPNTIAVGVTSILIRSTPLGGLPVGGPPRSRPVGVHVCPRDLFLLPRFVVSRRHARCALSSFVRSRARTTAPLTPSVGRRAMGVAPAVRIRSAVASVGRFGSSQGDTASAPSVGVQLHCCRIV